MKFSEKYLGYQKDFLINALEAVLFVSGDPVPVVKLAELFEITKDEVIITAGALRDKIIKDDSAFELVVLEDELQLCTKQDYKDYVSSFLEIKRTAMISKAALEALSVVAYKQPVTKGYIEKIRGVDCSGIINTLLQRELIEECGRLDAPGRPILYRTTSNFLRCFGLESLNELPDSEGEQQQIEVQQ
ncbi:MAG: SMC-Scp complex subunit ScpB [Firmicutes bacterium]|nr:SMC-Scp complex subunit ScpB [Bacillota bacterium]